MQDYSVKVIQYVACNLSILSGTKGLSRLTGSFDIIAYGPWRGTINTTTISYEVDYNEFG